MRFTALDSLRGIAATSVLLFHAGVLSVLSSNRLADGGYLFVDFFFVLSGFVITHSYKNRIQSWTGENSYRSFVIARFARVYPLHFFLLVCVWLPYFLGKYALYVFADADIGHFLKINTFETFVSNLFLTHSIGIHEHLSWNEPSWSISVEFYTYLAFGILMLASVKHWVFAAISAVGLVGIWTLNMDPIHGHGSLFAHADYGILRCFYGFFAGVITYHAVQASKFKRWGTTAEVVVLGAVLAAVANLHSRGYVEAICVPIFMLAIAVFSAESGRVSAILKLRPFAWAGERSYSIYLNHMIFVAVLHDFLIYILKIEYVTVDMGYYQKDFLDVPGGSLIVLGLIAAVLISSEFTYRYVEMPFNRKIKKWLAEKPAKVKGGVEVA